jgi:hypothetical protein
MTGARRAGNENRRQLFRVRSLADIEKALAGLEATTYLPAQSSAGRLEAQLDGNPCSCGVEPGRSGNAVPPFHYPGDPQ